MVEPAPGGECRPADAGTSQSGSCGLGDARGSSECLITAGGGEGVWVPQCGRGSGNPGLVGGRQELSVCPVLSRDLFGPHPEERTMWALPSRPPDLTGTRPPAAAGSVVWAPEHVPHPDPQSRVQGQDWRRGFSLGKQRTLSPRCEADGAGREKAES